MKFGKIYLNRVLLICLSLSACKTNKVNDNDLITPATVLYQNGLNFLDHQKHAKAAEEFGKVFYQHPGDKITPQAELMHAYSLFLASQYDEAVDVLEVFIKLHPSNIDIAYARYLRALSYYMQISNTHLDQSRTFLAKVSFEEVIKLYPDTKYAVDGELKIDLANDHLAGKEMEIGRFYSNKKNPVAAIKRFQQVINYYQTTSHVPEALYRLVLSYTTLGVPMEARKYAAVLGSNYLNTIWYKRSFELLTRAKLDAR
ncbi:MAG: outer membrane protein assembly factor BamD [Rickettsiaceae bacterium]|nr:MAG: outer membrane protein assembly factor BamD [Rickettsiaceae bacterium]